MDNAKYQAYCKIHAQVMVGSDGMIAFGQLKQQVHDQTLQQVNDRAWTQIWRAVCDPVYGIVCQQAMYPCITKAGR